MSIYSLIIFLISEILIILRLAGMYGEIAQKEKISPFKFFTIYSIVHRKMMEIQLEKLAKMQQK